MQDEVVDARSQQASSALASASSVHCQGGVDADDLHKVPVKTLLEPPSAVARLTCVSVLVGLLAVWGKLTFVAETEIAGGQAELHSWTFPFGMTVFYLISLPMLRAFATRYLEHNVDVKVLLRESMIIYNAAQVVLNGWMVYRIADAIIFRNHPFVGGATNLIDTGATYAVWVHYCNKYLEYFDTYFMVLRGKMDQVSFLHVYHHSSIAWAWWAGLKVYPGGDIYFGALLNSWIHVMMYSYYTLSLLKIRCPWKKYLTQAQLVQFISVICYSVWSIKCMPADSDWTHYIAYIVQVFEMVSLFVLFMHFYRRAYSKRKGSLSSQRSSDSTSLTNDSDSGSELVAEQVSLSSDSSDEQ